MDSGIVIARLLDVLLFRAGYNASVVVFGVTALGLAAGAVGTFLVLRRRALLSDALSHATLPGILLAFLLAGAMGWNARSLPLLLAGAAFSAFAGVFAVNAISRLTRITEDAAIGIVLSVFFAGGIVLLSYAQTLPTGGQAGLRSFIFGQAAALGRGEALGIAAIAAGSVLVLALLFKELRAVAFDETFARASGLPVARLDLAVALIAGIVTIAGLQAAGIVLVIALLIIPPVAARFWTARLAPLTCLSAAIGAVSAFLGAALSYALPDVPTGAAIVLAAAAFTLIGLLFAPRRGVVAAGFARALLSLRLARLRFLASLEGAHPALPARLGARLALRLEGLADASGRPSAKARRLAPAAARRLVVWEASLDLPADALPRGIAWGVDAPERVLPPEILAELEARARP